MDAKRNCSHVRLAYQFIEANKKQYSVEAMCRVLEVAPSGYYAWLNRDMSQRQRDNQRLLRQIAKIHAESRQTYGVPRVFEKLKSEGEKCGKKKVARLMKLQGLQ